MKQFATIILAPIFVGLFLFINQALSDLSARVSKNETKIIGNEAKIVGQEKILLRIDNRVYEIHMIINRRRVNERDQ